MKGSGNIPWASLLQPTIYLLTNGLPVSTGLAHAIQDKRNIILNESTLSYEFLFISHLNLQSFSLLSNKPY